MRATPYQYREECDSADLFDDSDAPDFPVRRRYYVSEYYDADIEEEEEDNA